MVIKISLGKCGACGKSKLLSGQLCSLVPSASIAPLFEGVGCNETTGRVGTIIDLLARPCAACGKAIGGGYKHCPKCNIYLRIRYADPFKGVSSKVPDVRWRI